MYVIRKTKNADLDRVMELFDMARVTMAGLGIDQWQDGYPYRENIEEDIRNGESYVVESEGSVVATFMLMNRSEITYQNIYDGAWITENDKQYATIHRITVEPSKRATSGIKDEKPVSALIVDFAREYARDLPGGVRVDTHEGNIAMRKMLEKNGFKYCGIIHLTDGQPRVAYQLI